ncbi:MAG: ABC transporter substrate-binding protein [Rhizobiales bacterium]|nr:ABC transporter substrate-binding protein [Hyphomicrobiales bacterium]
MSRPFTYGAVTDHAAFLARFGAAAGFFDREGIDLTVREVYGGPEMAAAVERGDVDVGEVGTPPGLTAIGAGRKIRIVGSALDRGLAFFLIARPEIRDWPDFRGTTVAALSKGSCGYWYMRDILEQHGIDPDRDVTFRHLGAEFDHQLELLDKGEIQAILSGGTFVALGEARGIVDNWGPPQVLADVPSIQWSIQIASEAFIAREPSLLADVLEAVRRTGHYVRDNPDEWRAFVQKLFGIDEVIAARAIAYELPYLHFDGQIDLPGLERALDLQYRVGSTPRRLSVDEVADLRYQPAASSEPAVQAVA